MVSTPVSRREARTRVRIKKASFSPWAFTMAACSACWGVRSPSASREAYSRILATGVLVWWEMSASRDWIAARSSARFRMEAAEPFKKRAILTSSAETADSSKEPS